MTSVFLLIYIIYSFYTQILPFESLRSVREKGMGCSQFSLDLSSPWKNCRWVLCLSAAPGNTEALKGLPVLCHGSPACTWCRGNQISIGKDSTVTLTQKMQIWGVTEDAVWMWVGDGCMGVRMSLFGWLVCLYMQPQMTLCWLCCRLKGIIHRWATKEKGFRAALSFVDFGAVLPCWKADRCVLEHGCWFLEGLLPVRDGLRASMMCWEPATIFQNTSTSFSLIISRW